jgi:hypothetical protein
MRISVSFLFIYIIFLQDRPVCFGGLREPGMSARCSVRVLAAASVHAPPCHTTNRQPSQLQGHTMSAKMPADYDPSDPSTFGCLYGQAPNKACAPLS